MKLDLEDLDLMISIKLYRFLIRYIRLHWRAAKSHWKLGSWHIQQEFCDFSIFFK